MIDTNNISDEVRTGEGTKHGNNRRTDCQDEWCMKYYHDANRYYKECQKLKFDLHSSNETNRELAAENSKLKKISTNEGLKRELTIAHGKIASLKDSQRKMVEVLIPHYFSIDYNNSRPINMRLKSETRKSRTILRCSRMLQKRSKQLIMI
jgi:hypothetical protein